MELNKLANTIQSLRNRYNLDTTDILLLNAVNEISKKQGGVVFTMQLVRRSDEVSLGTAHTHMKKLINMGMLERSYDQKNLRLKKLALTNKALEVIVYLEGV